MTLGILIVTQINTKELINFKIEVSNGSIYFYTSPVNCQPYSHMTIPRILLMKAAACVLHTFNCITAVSQKLLECNL